MTRASKRLSVVHVGRDGVEISAIEWTKFRGNKDYTFVKKFRNEKVSVFVEWIGKQRSPSKIPREYWKLFTVKVCNIIIVKKNGGFEAEEIQDPSLSKEFENESLALAYYRDTLVDLGFAYYKEESEYSEEGSTFTEKNNEFAPEKIEPEQVKSKGALVGSW